MRIKVILPTFMRSHYEQSEDDTTRLYEVEQYDTYEFSLDEALRYMIDNGFEFMFDEMILHNINMRNVMRKVGAKKLIDKLRILVKPSDRLDRKMRSFVKEWEDKSLGDIDIQVVPIQGKFVVDGIVFDGLEQLKASVDKSYYRSFINDRTYDCTPKIMPQCHIGEVREPYPTFDIYDCCDNRYYRNFLIRKRPIQDKELKAIHSIGRCNYCAITENTPTHLLPLVYYEGDGGFMLVAQRHNGLK